MLVIPTFKRPRQSQVLVTHAVILATWEAETRRLKV
jgi:hypothetical protein